MIWDTDSCCFRSQRPLYSTVLKLQTQDITAKNFYYEKPKIKKVKPTFSQANKVDKASKQAHKK